MRLYSNQELKKIYDNVNNSKEFWRVTNTLINICDEYPEQKTLYLLQISVIKYRELIGGNNNNELEIV